MTLSVDKEAPWDALLRELFSDVPAKSDVKTASKLGVNVDITMGANAIAVAGRVSTRTTVAVTVAAVTTGADTKAACAMAEIESVSFRPSTRALSWLFFCSNEDSLTLDAINSTSGFGSVSAISRTSGLRTGCKGAASMACSTASSTASVKASSTVSVKASSTPRFNGS